MRYAASGLPLQICHENFSASKISMMRCLPRGIRTAENHLGDFVKNSSLGRGRLFGLTLTHRNAKIITQFCQLEGIDAKRFEVLTDHSENARVGKKHACDKGKCRPSCINRTDFSLAQTLVVLL